MSEYNNDQNRQNGEYSSGSLNRDWARNTTQPGAYRSATYSDGYGGYNPQPQPQQSAPQQPAGGYNNYSPYTTPETKPKKQKKQKNHSHIGVIALCVCLSFVFGTAGSLLGNMFTIENGRITNRPGGTTVIYQQAESGLPATEVIDTGNAISNVAKKVQDSVVSIVTESLSSNPFMPQYIESGAGSGVIISQDGYILTCNHVVAGAANVSVSLYNGEEYPAVIVGTDPATDLAVIKIQAEGLVPAVIGNSDDLMVGETAIAVGNPLGTLGHTVSSGIVSALERQVRVEGQTMKLMQVDTAVNPGNSGGGLFDIEGNLIGIVNAKNMGDGIEGIGFAVPISTAMPVCESLMDGGYVSGRPALGVTIVTISDAETAQKYGFNRLGVYVYELYKDGPAEKAGVQVRDCILAIDDVVVDELSDITDYLATKEIGDTVTLQVAREDTMVNIPVTLGEINQ